MRTAIWLTLVATVLALAGNASAGCFATAGVVAPPAGIAPGETWNAVITVKQHGERPIPNATPTLTTISATGERKTYAAKPTDTVGVYAASVVFPAKGRWSYEVNDGFVADDAGHKWDCSTTHTFAAVDVGGPAPTPPSDPAPAPSASPDPAAAPAASEGTSWLPIVLTAAAVALAAFAGVALARRSGRRTVET